MSRQLTPTESSAMSRRVNRTRIPDYIKRPANDYYTFVGALDPATKGSGLATVCAAIYLFSRENNNQEDALYIAVNMLGSDTDTIASFLGALLGAKYGRKVIPSHLEALLQDRDYILRTAKRLHEVAVGAPQEKSSQDNLVGKGNPFSHILAWEIGLHEMFWDTIGEGDAVMHPTLGRGTITNKVVKKIRRENHVAKLIRINFECGQTCTFHSRVKDNEKVSESLAPDIDKAIRELH